MLKIDRLLLRAALLLPLVAGCDTGDDGGLVGGSPTPPAGSDVHVQFRRDYLGLATDKPATPMGDGIGTTLGATGKMKRLTGEFLILQVDNEPDRELWIPREGILLLDVKRVPQE